MTATIVLIHIQKAKQALLTKILVENSHTRNILHETIGSDSRTLNIFFYSAHCIDPFGQSQLRTTATDSVFQLIIHIVINCVNYERRYISRIQLSLARFVNFASHLRENLYLFAEVFFVSSSGCDIIYIPESPILMFEFPPNIRCIVLRVICIRMRALLIIQVQKIKSQKIFHAVCTTQTVANPQRGLV